MTELEISEYRNQPGARILNKRAQEKYFNRNVYDEVNLGFLRRFVPRDHIHEIQHGSSKTYEVWNMIALTKENHDEAHASEIPKRKLFIAKLLSGSCLPDEFPKDIIRKFDLGLIIKNFDKFKRRFVYKSYHRK